LHGMAYYIFLKSLRSLEEFRKNPHVEIPPKSPPTKFQSLAIIKKSNFYSEKNFSSLSAQNGPAASRPVRPLSPPSPPGAPLHPGLRGLGVIARSRLFFEFAQPGSYAFSLCHHHAGPTCQLRRLPRAARPRLKFPRAAAPRATRSPALDANQSLFTPHLYSTLNPR
jgi:hypothetical protein